MLMIDMDMPEDCIDCPLCHSEFFWCKLKEIIPVDKDIIEDWDGFDGRPEWCPLIEVKNEDN